MALTSPTKLEDLQFLTVWADIIEITFHTYQQHPTPANKSHLEAFIAFYEELKDQIATKDYTKDDEFYWRLQALFELSPPTP